MNIILGVVSITIAAVALYYAYEAFRIQRKVAKAKGEIDFRLEFQFNRKYSTSLNILIDIPENSAIEIPLELIVVNRSEAVAKDVNLFVSYPDIIHPTKDNLIFEKTDVLDFRTEKEFVSFQKGKGKIHSYRYSFDRIEPNSGSVLMEKLIFHGSTYLRTEVEAMTKDSVPVKMTIGVDYAYTLRYKLECGDFCSSGSISVHVWNLNDQPFQEFFSQHKSVFDFSKEEIESPLNRQKSLTFLKYERQTHKKKNTRNYYTAQSTYYSFDCMVSSKGEFWIPSQNIFGKVDLKNH